MKFIKNLILFIFISIGVLLIYSLIIIGLIKLSQLFEQDSLIGNIFSETALWGGQFGFGIIIYPLLVIIIFLVIIKRGK
jgi:hypothetical protein